MFLINVVQDRDKWRAVIITVMNLRVCKSMANFLTSRGPVSVSRRSLLHLVSKYNYSCSHRGVKKTT
jgi:hypothetical protein